MGAAILAILLTQSRGALAAAAIGAVAWLAIVPLRLRSLPRAPAAGRGAGGVAAWALSKDAFSEPPSRCAARRRGERVRAAAGA